MESFANPIPQATTTKEASQETDMESVPRARNLDSKEYVNFSTSIYESEPNVDSSSVPQRLINEGSAPPSRADTDDSRHTAFMRDLYEFMEKTGNPIVKPPSLGFKELDLYRLYTAVTSRGGMEEVTSKQLWKAVYTDLDLSAMSTSASYNTRTNYKKYLYLYELDHFETPEDIISKGK